MTSDIYLLFVILQFQLGLGVAFPEQSIDIGLLSSRSFAELLVLVLVDFNRRLKYDFLLGATHTPSTRVGLYHGDHACSGPETGERKVCGEPLLSLAVWTRGVLDFPASRGQRGPESCGGLIKSPHLRIHCPIACSIYYFCFLEQLYLNQRWDLTAKNWPQSLQVWIRCQDLIVQTQKGRSPQSEPIT